MEDTSPPHTLRAPTDLTAPARAQFPGSEGGQCICREWKVYFRSRVNTCSSVFQVHWVRRDCPPPFLKSRRCLFILFPASLCLPVLQTSLTTELVVREGSKNSHLVCLVQHIPRGCACPEITSAKGDHEQRETWNHSQRLGKAQEQSCSHFHSMAAISRLWEEGKKLQA